MTLRQLLNKDRGRIRKKKRNKVAALSGAPYKKAVVHKLFIEKPKKPNSAKRKCIEVRIKETGKKARCYVPGIGFNLAKHSVVLIRGGRCQDLIGFRYKAVRNKFDLSKVQNRVSRKTKYGIK